jgi:hypothetical protein
VSARLAALDTARFRKFADSLAAGRKPAALGPDTSKSKVDSIQARDQAKAQRAADSLNRGALSRTIYDSLYREAKQEILDEAAAHADSLASKAKAESAAKGDSASEFRKLGVNCLTVKGSSIWIGTTDGLYEYKKSSVTRRGQSLLPSQYISGIAAQENLDEIYVGMKGAGVARYTPAKSAGSAAKWKLFGMADGLVDSTVHQILLDKDGHVWAAHTHGISHYTALRVWEKIHFRKQELRSMALDEDGHIWIATNEGAWKYTPKHTNAQGRLEQKKEAAGSGGAPKQDLRADWVHFHSGNGLADKDVFDVKAQGPDVWFISGAGIERYNSAKSQVGFFYESLLPVLNLPDLYHAFIAATFPVEEWGTVGGFINYVSFGKNTQTNAAGDETRSFESYELVGALSYGTRLGKNIGLGLNAKFIYSALAQGVTSSGEKTDGIAISYAVDAGLLWKNVLVKGLSAGLMLQNMGPAVFYVDQAQADPIPFTNHRITVAVDANREAVYREGNEASPVYVGAWKDLVYPYEDKDHSNSSVVRENIRQTVYNMGTEYVIANVVGLRAGYLYDFRGQRYEMDMGAGFMISDILQVDGTFIKSFDNGIRNNQKRFSILLRF